MRQPRTRRKQVPDTTRCLWFGCSSQAIPSLSSLLYTTLRQKNLILIHELPPSNRSYHPTISLIHPAIPATTFGCPFSLSNPWITNPLVLLERALFSLRRH